MVDLSTVTWRRSTRSGVNGNCVEVCDLPNGGRAVRDSKDKGHGAILVFTRDEWSAFIAGAKLGEFD